MTDAMSSPTQVLPYAGPGSEIQVVRSGAKQFTLAVIATCWWLAAFVMTGSMLGDGRGFDVVRTLICPYFFVSLLIGLTVPMAMHSHRPRSVHPLMWVGFTLAVCAAPILPAYMFALAVASC